MIGDANEKLEPALQAAQNRFKNLAKVNLAVQTGFLALAIPLLIFCYIGIIAGANPKKGVVFWSMLILSWPYYVQIAAWLLYFLKAYRYAFFSCLTVYCWPIITLVVMVFLYIFHL